MGIVGALGNMNFTSSNFCRRRQFSAREAHPAPLSPRPWAIITVAVCFFTAGMMREVGLDIVLLWLFVEEDGVRLMVGSIDEIKDGLTASQWSIW